MRITLLVTVIFISVVSTVFATEQPVIVNTGEAVVMTLPGTVEFKFVRHFSGDTLQNAVEQYNAYIEAAPQAIRGSELQPTEILNSPRFCVQWNNVRWNPMCVFGSAWRYSTLQRRVRYSLLLCARNLPLWRKP